MQIWSDLKTEARACSATFMIPDDMEELDAFTHAMASAVATIGKIDHYNKNVANTGLGIRKSNLTIDIVTTAIFEIERKQKEILTGDLVGTKCRNPDDPTDKGKPDAKPTAPKQNQRPGSTPNPPAAKPKDAGGDGSTKTKQELDDICAEKKAAAIAVTDAMKKAHPQAHAFNPALGQCLHCGVAGTNGRVPHSHYECQKTTLASTAARCTTSLEIAVTLRPAQSLTLKFTSGTQGPNRCCHLWRLLLSIPTNQQMKIKSSQSPTQMLPLNYLWLYHALEHL